MAKSYLSTTEYAHQHRISKMQVIRLIRAGKIAAERVGRDWMILGGVSDFARVGMIKTDSLAKWNKIIKHELHKELKIEKSKDREVIYTRLHGLGLPHERCMAFGFGEFPTRARFEIAVGRLGLPYWISAVPDPESPNLDRMTKLRIYDIKSGWDFVNALPEKQKYKVIVSQYPEDPQFKGTVLISQKGLGIAEFVTGDRHYVLSRGFALTNPMLFDQHGIVRFSETVAKDQQRNLFKLVRGIYGQLECQYGRIGKNKLLTFLDYNNDSAYIEIDQIWKDVVRYFKSKRSTSANRLYGLPASPGKASGRCVVVHHENVGWFAEVKRGDILISDAAVPEMTDLLSRAAAVVTDLGGVTNYSAIVYRELKLPAVVGVGNATERLRTGQRVRIDADKGEVVILEQ